MSEGFGRNRGVVLFYVYFMIDVFEKCAYFSYFYTILSMGHVSIVFYEYWNIFTLLHSTWAENYHQHNFHLIFLMRIQSAISFDETRLLAIACTIHTHTHTVKISGSVHRTAAQNRPEGTWRPSYPRGKWSEVQWNEWNGAWTYMAIVRILISHNSLY